MANGVTWRIVSQQETTRPDNSGRFVSGVLVMFQTSNGLTGSVFVPDQQYTPDVVRQLVQQRVDLMTAVHTLEG